MTPAARQPFRDELRARLIRHGDLVPCKTAFIDSRTPGSDRKENFTLIGAGVSESPDQHVHITLPHGFNIGAARQPPHCVNSQHYHETAEAFFAHSGTWTVTTGERADEGRAELSTGSLISVPVHVFRGFENISEDVGFLYFMLGGDDPGRVTWAPDVLEKARDHGLILMETGRLVDTLAGQSQSMDERPQAPAPREALNRIVVHLNDAAIRQVVVSLEEARAFDSAIGAPGVVEAAMLGPANPAERAPAGKLDRRHGFVTRSLSLEPRAASPRHRRGEPEVIFLHEGALTIEVEGEPVELSPGDTFSVPLGAVRQFRAADGRAVALVTRGADLPVEAELVG